MAIRRRRSSPDVTDLEAEGLLHCETVPGTLTYRHVRSPTRRTSWATEPTRWTVAVTRTRLVVRRDTGPMVNVPWLDSRISTLTIAVDGTQLLIGANTDQFHPDTSGIVEVRATVADPVAVTSLIERMRSTAARGG